MSTLKTDAIISATSGADLSLSGDAGGVVDVEAGFKVGGTVGVPTASIQDDAVTLAKMAAAVDGVVISYDASGNPVHVGPGTDGQVLTSTGAGSPPAFEDAGGGAWAKVASGGGGTVAELAYTSLGTKDTWLRLRGVTSSVNWVLAMRMVIAQSGSYVTTGTGYNATGLSTNGASAPSYAYASSYAEAHLTPGSNSIPSALDGSRDWNLDLNFFSPGGTSRHKNWSAFIWRSNDDAPSVQRTIGSFDANTSALSGFKLYTATGYDFNYTSYEIMELN